MNDLIDPKAKKLLLNKKENINYFIINIAGNNQNTISINNLLIRQLKSKYQATNSLRQDILINHLNNIKKVENKLDNIKSLKNNLDLTNKLLESLNNKKMIIIGISLVSIASIIQLSKLISQPVERRAHGFHSSDQAILLLLPQPLDDFVAFNFVECYGS